jgi:peptidoglycan/xylan/chitin deacetylase (PgdA/CDA1 family)
LEWQKEIVGPKKLLESITGQKVDIFVYPYGRKKDEFDFGKWTKQLEDSGFKYALNTYRSFSGDSGFDPFWIEKYSVHSEDRPLDIVSNAHKYNLR